MIASVEHGHPIIVKIQTSAPDVLNGTLNYTKMGSKLTPDDVTCVSLIVEKVAMLPNISPHVATLLLQNVDYMQGASLETFAVSNQPGRGDGTTQRMLNAVHNMVKNLADANFDYMSGEQLGLRAIDSDKYDTDLSLGHDGKGFDSEPKDTSVASITIPKEALDGGGRAYVSYWKTNKLFIPKRITYARSTEQSGQYITSLTHADKCSQTLTPTGKDPVLTGTLIDKSSDKFLTSPKQLQAIITYDKEKALHPLHGEYKVTWWNTDFFQWSREDQCEMVRNTGKVVAHCYHLTDFTLVENDPLVCSVPLQVIAYILNILSIVCLIMFITIRVARFVRRANSASSSTSELLLNRFLHKSDANDPILEDLMYTAFLLIFYVFFTCFKDQRSAHNACEAMGGIAYFLFLCIPFQIFVFAVGDVALRVNFQKVGAYASPATALGVSVALSFAITVGLGAGSDFFQRNDEFCWIRPTYVVPGIILPLVFIFSTGLMATASVVWVIFDKRNKNSDLNAWQTKKERLLRIVRIVQMQLHLGLPWIFQFASLAFPYCTAWHYLFSFTNDSQGIIHLLIFFLFDRIESYRRDHEANRPEMDQKDAMEQERTDRDLLDSYYHNEPEQKESNKAREERETTYDEIEEIQYYSTPAATSTPVSAKQRTESAQYEEPPGETYSQILARIEKEDLQRHVRFIELKTSDFSVESALWEGEDEEAQEENEPEQEKNSTTESSQSNRGEDNEVFNLFQQYGTAALMSYIDIDIRSLVSYSLDLLTAFVADKISNVSQTDYHEGVETVDADVESNDSVPAPDTEEPQPLETDLVAFPHIGEHTAHVEPTADEEADADIESNGSAATDELSEPREAQKFPDTEEPKSRTAQDPCPPTTEEHHVSYLLRDPAKDEEADIESIDSISETPVPEPTAPESPSAEPDNGVSSKFLSFMSTGNSSPVDTVRDHDPVSDGETDAVVKSVASDTTPAITLSEPEQTSPTTSEHQVFSLKAHEDEEEQLHWLTGPPQIRPVCSTEAKILPEDSTETVTLTQTKGDDEPVIKHTEKEDTEEPEEAPQNRAPSYVPPPPPTSTLPPSITTEPPAYDDDGNVIRVWKDHNLKRQHNVDES
uniref:G_PROTEIN_RECEP_F2_4 domain-containing protein n=1 Tax=Steinernema glaseri TaxID=37863 RepID=A0A1I7Z4W8_9BILA